MLAVIKMELSGKTVYGRVKDQGCGLGLDVSVWRRINVSSRSRRKISTSQSHLGLGRLTSRSRVRLGLGHLCLAPETNFPPNFAGHNNKVNQVSRRC